MLPRLSWLLSAGVAILILAACGPGNTVEGSIGEVFDLDFDYSRIRKQDQVLVVEYIKNIAGGENKVLKIVLEGHRLVAQPGGLTPLTDNLVVEDEMFQQAVTLSRVTPTGSDFPPVAEGVLAFAKLNFVGGGEVSGQLAVAFENGRTLSATFSGKIEEIDLQ